MTGVERQTADPGDTSRAGRPAARLGVLGWPVAHSRSPAMHTAALVAVGLGEWTYQRLPVPPELFEETVRALGGAGFVGANVTIPHKHAALALADSATAAARTIGAANTLSFASDGSIAAENTDAPGLIAAIEGAPPHGLGRPVAGLHALVLGAGGSARAAVWALRAAGAREVSVWNRTAARAAALAGALDARAVPEPEPGDILVNCTSVGLDAAPASDAEVRAASGEQPAEGRTGASEKPTEGRTAAGEQPTEGRTGASEKPTEGRTAAGEQPTEVRAATGEQPAEGRAATGEHGALPSNATDGQAVADALNQLHLTLDLVGRYSYVVDLVYRQGTTPLLLAAREAGVPALDGLQVLVAQGALSFELWTGRPAPLEIMRAAARGGDPGN